MSWGWFFRIILYNQNVGYLKKKFILFFSVGLITLCLWICAVSLPALFRLERIDVVTHGALLGPDGDDQVRKILDLKLGHIAQFDFTLSELEKKLLSYDWIEKAKISRRYFHGLLVDVYYRVPMAYLNSTKQKNLMYVDHLGKVFGRVNLLTHLDLPYIAIDLDVGNEGVLQKAVELSARWNQSQLAGLSPLSSVVWDVHNGFKILTWYQSNAERVRLFVELGHFELDDNKNNDKFNEKLTRLAEVITYLSEHSIATHRILMTQSKKVVVKTL